MWVDKIINPDFSMIENMKGDMRSDDTKRTERGRNEKQISNLKLNIP